MNAMVFMIVHILLLLVVTYYTHGFKISFNTNILKEAMTNKRNDNSNNNRVVPRGVSSNMSNSYKAKPKLTTPISKRAFTASKNISSRKKIDNSLTPKRQSIFDVFGIFGRLDTLEAELKELKSMIIMVLVFFFSFEQWDKSGMKEERSQDKVEAKEERRLDKVEAKENMAIMREEMRLDKVETKKDFYLTTSISVAALVVPLISSQRNNNRPSSNDTSTK